MEESKIYKYTSIETAIKIIQSNGILLNNSVKFNDPFDGTINIDKNEMCNAFELQKNYLLLKELKKVRSRITFEVLAMSEPLKSLLKEIDRKETANINYEIIQEVESVWNIILTINNDVQLKRLYDYTINNIKSIFYKNYETFKNEMKENILITCFCEVNNSMLMWSHYGNSHEGVCIEFEQEPKYFYKVKYTAKKPKLKIKELTQNGIYIDRNQSELLFSKKILNNLLSFYTTKSKDWDYEKEIRFITNTYELSKGNHDVLNVHFSEGRYFLNLKIKKIYIGVKANGEQLNTLIQMALNRNISIVYMKEDEKEYSIIEDTERKVKVINYEQTNEINCIKQLHNEIQNCIKQRNYISAIVSSLLIPSILGQFEYKELNKKESYVKWFNEHVKCEIEDDMNGEICWEIYESVNNKGILFNNENNDLKINFNIHKYDNSPLDEMSPNSEVNILDLDISNFCNNIIDGSKYAIDYKDLLHFKISDFDKKYEDILSLNRSFQRN